MKTIKFFTLGCKVNQYDTQNIREQFFGLGFKEVKGPGPADIYLINTCTVTHRSDADSLYLIRKSKRENPKSKIIITGCYSQLDSNKISRENKVDLVIKNQDKDNAAEIFAKKFIKNKKMTCPSKGISFFDGHTRAFIKIQDGCNNLCSYCRVPQARGKSKSKKLAFIIAEAEKLVENGFKEIVLCGVCLGSYGADLKPRMTLLNIINELEKIDGLLRIRLSSIEAMDVTRELIEKMTKSEKLCHHLHIPIQSGDDNILKVMNRKYTSKDYLNLIRKIQKLVKDVAITSDVLVGFPGETENNFNNSVKLVKAIKPLKVHVFPYSPRPGTLAVKNMLSRQVDPVIIKTRVLKLGKISDKLNSSFKKRFFNKKIPVLFERKIRNEGNVYEGYSSNYLKVTLNSDKDISNTILTVTLNQENLKIA